MPHILSASLFAFNVLCVGDTPATNVFLEADKTPVTPQDAIQAFSDVEGLAI